MKSFCTTRQRGTASRPCGGRVWTCPVWERSLSVSALLPRHFVLVTVHLTSSHGQSAGIFLSPLWVGSWHQGHVFWCSEAVSRSKCFIPTCSNALWRGSSYRSHSALNVSACGCMNSAPGTPECASHSTELKNAEVRIYPFCTSLTMIGRKCIFRDVESAVMTLWLCPKLAGCWRRWPLTDSDYGSMFAADAFRAIIWEIQTTWLALKVTGHSVGAVITAANDITTSLLQHWLQKILPPKTVLCSRIPKMTSMATHCRCIYLWHVPAVHLGGGGDIIMFTDSWGNGCKKVAFLKKNYRINVLVKERIKKTKCPCHCFERKR